MVRTERMCRVVCMSFSSLHFPGIRIAFPLEISITHIMRLPPLRFVMPNAHCPNASGKALARLVIDLTLEGISEKYFEGMEERASSEESYLLLSIQACIAQLLQAVRHHSCEISRVRYCVFSRQRRSQFLVEPDDNEGSLEHGTSFQRTTCCL